MANINGANYAKEYVNDPSERANVGELGGRKRVIFDQWSGAAGLDVVFFGKIPAGARILDLNISGGLSGGDGGTAATFNVAQLDKISAEQDLTLTLDADGNATGSVWVEYLLD